jgi:hypothetical protein
VLVSSNEEFLSLFSSRQGWSASPVVSTTKLVKYENFVVLWLKGKKEKEGGGGALSTLEETSLTVWIFGRFFKHNPSCPESLGV